jgi:hypothetical protein
MRTQDATTGAYEIIECMPLDSIVHFSRPSWKYRDAGRSYTIEVDGVDRGTIKAGGTLLLEVPAGAHVVRARIDWSGSRHLNINTEPGQTAYVRIEPNGGVWKVPFQMFTRQFWVRITKIDPPQVM